MMRRAVAESPRGCRVTVLTAEAFEAWAATELDARRLAWIDDQLGSGVDRAWRALGLSVCRAEIFGADGGMRWQPMPSDSRLGEPVIVVPIWAHAPGHWLGARVCDMVAIDPSPERRCASRTGICAALGEAEVDGALIDGETIVWHEDPLSWVRVGGNARRYVDSASPARFFVLEDDSDVAERVLLQATEIQAESDAHGHRLVEQARALRRRLMPRMPEILVAEMAEAA